MRTHAAHAAGSGAIFFAILLMVLVTSTARAEITRSFTENFSTKQFCDAGFTTIYWDTINGLLRLPNFSLTTGVYNTSGQANAVAVAGECAYVCDGSAGFSVIRIANPNSPSLMGSVDTPGDAWGVALVGDYAFVADGAGGLQVIDVSNPYSPSIAGGYDTPYVARGIAVDGDYAAVADLNTGVIFLNITNPASPAYISTYVTAAPAMSVALDGDLAYVAARGAGLVILDISNPAAPTYLGGYNTPGDCWGVAVDGDKVYLGDGGAGMHIIDVTDPTAPVWLGGYDTDAARGVSVNGNMVFVANYANTYVLDVENPAAPAVEYVIDTWGIASGIYAAGELMFVACGDEGGLFVMEYQDFAGPFDTGYASLSPSPKRIVARDDYVYVANGSAGLSVVDISDPDNPLFLQSDATYAAGAYAKDLAVAGDYLYLASSNTSNSGLHVFDLGDPSSPQEVAEYPVIGEATSLAIDGDVLLYSSEHTVATACSVFVFITSDPENPVRAGSFLNEWDDFTAITIEGDYAYLLQSGVEGEVLVADISNPYNPVRVDSLALPDMSSGHSIVIAGDVAYAAGAGNGVHVIDISDPAHPVLANTVDTNGSVNDLVIQGQYLFIADYNGGVKVMDIRFPCCPVTLETLPAGGTAFDIAASGEHIFSADVFFSRIRSMQAFERSFDADANQAQSQVVAHTDDYIVRAAVTATPHDGLLFELSANNGTSWSPAGFGAGTFVAIQTMGVDLKWHSTHRMTAPAANPICSEIRIDWLYRFAMIDSIVDVPGDDGGWARIHFTRSGYDFAGDSTYPVTGYSVYRRIDDPAGAALAAAGAGTPKLAGLPPGEWETVGYVTAQQQAAYTCLVPTLADSGAAMRYSVYCISASTTTPSKYYISYTDSGYSVDNLPPPVPSGFTVFYRPSGNTLAWGACPAGECASFRIYRSLTEDFIPAPDNLLHETTATVWQDTTDGGWSYHYKLTAMDNSGNESVPASPDNIVGAGNPVAPLQTALYQNVPNPFNPYTAIVFDLSEAAPVRLEIFDILGRSVRVLLDEVKTAGRTEITWDGRDGRGQQAASGIYFCRMKSGEFMRTIRMTLVK